MSKIKPFLPAIFLLLSFVLPWWTMVYGSYAWGEWGLTVSNSFLWGEINTWGKVVFISLYINSWNYSGFVFTVPLLIVEGGVIGMSREKRARYLGGLLGIIGVFAYFVLIHSVTFGIEEAIVRGTIFGKYFGYTNRVRGLTDVTVTFALWFLSIGFYLAVIGSILLLLPAIRTLANKVKGRIKQ